MALDPKTMTDAAKIRVLSDNARRQGREDIVLACRLRIAELAGQQFQEVLEREYWTALTAAEEFKTEENGKTTRLSRTRQKYARVGARQVIEDLAASPKITDGFRVLVSNGRPDLTFEGVVLRHSSLFTGPVIEASRHKLASNGVDQATIEGWLNGQG
ncbi:MAG: hypothetical protein KF723_11215 [Rhizobiaceae bacterium]|nr:hypothetical protein [Rhizobiaceae bacterium]